MGSFGIRVLLALGAYATFAAATHHTATDLSEEQGVLSLLKAKSFASLQTIERCVTKAVENYISRIANVEQGMAKCLHAVGKSIIDDGVPKLIGANGIVQRVKLVIHVMKAEVKKFTGCIRDNKIQVGDYIKVALLAALELIDFTRCLLGKQTQ